MPNTTTVILPRSQDTRMAFVWRHFVFTASAVRVSGEGEILSRVWPGFVVRFQTIVVTAPNFDRIPPTYGAMKSSQMGAKWPPSDGQTEMSQRVDFHNYLNTTF
jgi:hypothetical protein